jgi:hypothetical protein
LANSEEGGKMPNKKETSFQGEPKSINLNRSQDIDSVKNGLLSPPPDFNLNGDALPVRLALSKYEDLRITDHTPIPKPTPIIKIAEEIISTPEAITVISGLPKAGKTAFLSILIAGAILTDGTLIDGLELVQVLVNKARKAVIHFETEQAPWKQQANQRTILTRTGLDSCPEYLLSYNIRKLEIDELQPTVSNICELAAERFNGIHSIWIDGIADFIIDPNDPGASFEIVKYFESIAQKYFCPVIVVIHTNPTSSTNDKERGHLGSQVQRKAEGILVVKKSGNISFLDPKLLRHASDDIPKIQFRYDYEKGYHTQCNENEPMDKKVIEKSIRLKTVCEKIFSGQLSYQYKDAIAAIIKETALGTSTAKGMFTEMRAHELIVQGDDSFWRKKT